MKCPKCSSKMEKVKYQNVEVDKCIECKGIWFDAMELEELIKMQGSEIIDTNDKKLRKKYNNIESIKCPKCSMLMINMVDLDQPHIWYEQCNKCAGIFLDAGEFKDLKENTIADFFKKINTILKGGRN